MAATALTAGNDRLFLESVTCMPVCFSTDLIWSGDSAGLHCFRTAPIPAAAGVACDVPENVDFPPPRPSETITDPGASTSTLELLLLKHVILLAVVVASKQLAAVHTPEGG